MKITQKKGFTMAELVVVVLIIGILSAIALPQYKSIVTRARYTDMRMVVEQLGDAQEAYALEHGHYATQFNQLKDFSVKGWTADGNLLQKKNNDKLIASISLSKVYATRDDVQGHMSNFSDTADEWAINGALYDGNGNNIINRYLLYLPHGFNRPGERQCRSVVGEGDKINQRHPNNHLCDSVGGVACWRETGENVYTIEELVNNSRQGRNVCRAWDGTAQDIESVAFFMAYYGSDWRSSVQGNVAK